jgi:hypothetical protein
MGPLSYHGATSLDDCLRTLAEASPSATRLLAGGTDFSR